MFVSLEEAMLAVHKVQVQHCAKNMGCWEGAVNPTVSEAPTLGLTKQGFLEETEFNEAFLKSLIKYWRMENDDELALKVTNNSLTQDFCLIQRLSRKLEKLRRLLNSP